MPTSLRPNREVAPYNSSFELVHGRKTIKQEQADIHRTTPRVQTKDLDIFPVVNRSLIDYESYHHYIGHAGVKYSMAIQATRGCPYKCFYCDIYKTNPNHNRRSVQSFFDEVKMLYDLGVRRFEFIDDIFNVHQKSCTEFFELVLKHKVKAHFFFPTGLKGDLLDRDMIDLMVEAGSIGMNLSLEHAAPRMQEIMRKRLDVDKLHENLVYISEQHPHVNLTLNAMHGFPTETEEEAIATLEFILSIHWLDFPYLHNVRIFPGTELEYFAVQSGITQEEIEASQDMSYHESSPTLPFSQDFTMGIRTRLLRDYLLNPARLRDRIPYQMQNFSKDELDQRYRAYFPSHRINALEDVLKLAKLDPETMGSCLDEDQVRIPNLTSKLRQAFPDTPTRFADDALRLQLIDLSSYFSTESDVREYNVLEPPLGLMALMSHVHHEFGDRVRGDLIKSFVDFNSYQELLERVTAFRPHLIGIRAMTFYSGLFHDAIEFLREHGVTTPIIVGGPYPTASYADVLQDRNIDLAVIAEGEHTLTEILRRTIDNNHELPGPDELSEIDGIAYHLP